eukprot:g1805.t1
MAAMASADAPRERKKRSHESVDYIVHPDPKHQVMDVAEDGARYASADMQAAAQDGGGGGGTTVAKHLPGSPPHVSLFRAQKLNFSVEVRGRELSTEGESSGRKFTVYIIVVTQLNPLRMVWSVARRYSQFAQLRSDLRQLGVVCSELPPKGWGTNFSENFLDKRQQKLSTWIQQLPPLYRQAQLIPLLEAFLLRNCKAMSSSFSRGAEGGYGDGMLGTPGSGPGGATAMGMLVSSSPGSVSADVGAGGRMTTPSRLAPGVNLSNFELLKVLGKGSYGKVFLVKKRDGRDAGQHYAMKVLKKDYVVQKRQVQHTKTERNVLGTIIHPFIVKLHYAFQTGQKLHFVLDYCSGGEIFFHLQKHGRFPPKLALFYTAELALALGELHKNGIVFRDLKPENVLLDAEGHVQLADFGLSKEGVIDPTTGTRSFCGTPEYLAPEVLERKGHGFAVDWWSLGALLYEMLTGLPPWYSRDRKKMFNAIRTEELNFPAYVAAEAKALISDFLIRNPCERLGGRGGDVNEIKSHSIFRFVDWQALLDRRINPPWKPTTDVNDASNFEDVFTTMPVASYGSHVEGSPLATSASVGRGVRGSTFEGFSFVAEGVLGEESFQQRLGSIGRSPQELHGMPPHQPAHLASS